MLDQGFGKKCYCLLMFVCGYISSGGTEHVYENGTKSMFVGNINDELSRDHRRNPLFVK